jgi:hypothetical protein
MARNDELLKGLGIGVGAVLLLPVVVTAIAPVVRALGRSAVKAGVWAYEKSRESMEEFGEAMEDIKAEVEEELRQAHEAREAMGAFEGEAPDAVEPGKHER